MSNAENIRLAIAAQPTIEQSISALLRAVANRLGAPVTDTGPDSAHALATAITADPKSWSDAVLANTPLALQSAGAALPIPVSGNMDDTRATVAAQPSIGQSVAAFLRHVCHHIFKAADGDDAGAKTLGADISADLPGWTAALLANTPPVASSDLAPIPPHVVPAFATLASEPAEEAADQPARKPTAAEKRQAAADARDGNDV